MVSIGSNGQRDPDYKMERPEQSDETGEDVGARACQCGPDPDAAEYRRGHPQPIIRQRMVRYRSRPHAPELGDSHAPRSKSEEKGNAPPNRAEEQAELKRAEQAACSGDHGSKVFTLSGNVPDQATASEKRRCHDR